MKYISYLFASVAVAAAVSACSTVRVLGDGEYRLAKNNIIVEGDSTLSTSLISPYIKQKAQGWNPMLYVYNWSGKNSNSIFSKFFRLIGKAPVVYNPDLVNTSVSNMERQMEYLGYYNTTVVPEVRLDGKKVSVTYLVKAGKRYRIRDIQFELPDDPQLQDDFFRDTANLSIKKGSYLSMATLEAETIRSSAYMRENGWYDLHKNLYTFEADTIRGKGTASLVMKLRQPESSADGKTSSLLKYKFGKVSVSLPETFPLKESVIKNINTIRPGSQYSESAISNTYSRFSSLSAVSGVNITTDPAERPGVVDCLIDLAPARQRGFKLNLEASTSSNGLIGLSPEITYTNRNVFHGGETLNLGFSGDFQFKPGTDIRSREFGVSAGINVPRFMLLPTKWFKNRIPTTQIKASYNFQDRPEYMRSIIATSYTYLGSHRRIYYQISPLKINIVKLFNIDEAFYTSLATNPFLRNAYQNHLDIGSGATVLYTTDASIIPSGSYHYVRLQVDVAGNVLGAFKGSMKKNSDGAGLIWNTPFSQYIRGELTLGRTWSFGRHSLAGRILVGAGYAYGNSTALPFEKHFYSGGANSLRGWQARSIGPGFSKKDATFVIPSQTGDMKFEANLEYRFDIYKMLSGAVFTDIGNIWTLNKANDSAAGRFSLKDFPESLAADWGLGLRLNFNVLLVRLDAGFKVHDPSRDAGNYWVSAKDWFKKDGFAIHLGVGLPF